MKQFEMQHDGQHDKLGNEYEGLWTNVDVILEEIEKHFEDEPFYAKVLLSEIFVVIFLKLLTHSLVIIPPSLILEGLSR